MFNFKAENLTEKLNNFVVSQTLEKQTGNPSNSPIKNLLKSFIKDYLLHFDGNFCISNFYIKKVLKKITSETDVLKSLAISVFSPPPKLV